MVDPFEGDTLGERVKAARTLMGMSQGDLSRKSGVSQQLISVMENRGLGTRRDKLEKLAAALECNPNRLDPHFDKGDEIVGSSRKAKTAKRSKAKDADVSGFLERLSVSLEDKLGFRPTPLQAVKYLARIADPSDELGLRDE